MASVSSVRSKGTLKKWFNEKGFGFISPSDGGRDVFIHISAFDRGISREPKVGDTIFYYVGSDKDGKTKAVDAIIEGVAVQTRVAPLRPKKHYRKRKSDTGWRMIVFSIIAIIGLGSTLYSRMQGNSTSSILHFKTSSAGVQTSSFSCQGKTRCTQMTSCEEATFYIRNCPNTEMDGDGDGIPCERQWCH